MLTYFMRRIGRAAAILVAALSLQALTPPLRADELADFRAALDDATAHYRAAMTTLETGSREQTAAEVGHFRASWQTVIAGFETWRPIAFGAPEDQEAYAGLFMQIDARIVGALIVIDIGSRDAARAALAPIAVTLADLRGKMTPMAK